MIRRRSPAVIVLFGTVILFMRGAGCSLVSNGKSDPERMAEEGIAEVDSIHVPPRTGSEDRRPAGETEG